MHNSSLHLLFLNLRRLHNTFCSLSCRELRPNHIRCKLKQPSCQSRTFLLKPRLPRVQSSSLFPSPQASTHLLCFFLLSVVLLKELPALLTWHEFCWKPGGLVFDKSNFR